MSIVKKEDGLGLHNSEEGFDKMSLEKFERIMKGKDFSDTEVIAAFVTLEMSESKTGLASMLECRDDLASNISHLITKMISTSLSDLSHLLHRKDLFDDDNFVKFFYMIFIKVHPLLELRALFLLSFVRKDLADEITRAFVRVGEA